MVQTTCTTQQTNLCTRWRLLFRCRCCVGVVRRCDTTVAVVVFSTFGFFFSCFFRRALLAPTHTEHVTKDNNGNTLQQPQRPKTRQRFARVGACACARVTSTCFVYIHTYARARMHHYIHRLDRGRYNERTAHVRTFAVVCFVARHDNTCTYVHRPRTGI